MVEDLLVQLEGVHAQILRGDQPESVYLSLGKALTLRDQLWTYYGPQPEDPENDEEVTRIVVDGG